METKDSLGKSIGTFLDERLSNPVVSTFALAWSVWNYKLIIVVLSKATLTQTFDHIFKLYPDWCHRIGFGLVAPALSVTAYFWVVPVLTTKYYIWTAKARKAQDEAKYASEKHQRLSPAESAELQDSVRRLRADLTLQTNTIEKLNADLRNAADQDQRRLSSIADLQQQLQKAEQAKQDAQSALAEKIAEIAEARKRRGSEALAVEFRVAMGLADRDVIVLKALAESASGVIAARSTDQSIPDVTSAEALEAFKSLAEKKLVVPGIDEKGITYEITQGGIDALRYREAFVTVNASSEENDESKTATSKMSEAQRFREMAQQMGTTAVFREAARSLTDLEAQILQVAAASPVGSVAKSGLDSYTPGYDDQQVELALEILSDKRFVEIRQDIPGGAVVLTSSGRGVHEERIKIMRLNPGG